MTERPRLCDATVTPALEQALACHRTPSFISAALVRPLPEGMAVLLRIAAGERGLAKLCSDAAGEPEGRIVDAAAFFLQQVLFQPGADSYRILGADRNAPWPQIRDHYRWLVRWLHPDRNQDDWESAYAERVNQAWNDLRTPERRAQYDLGLDEIPAGGGAAVWNPISMSAVLAPDVEVPSPTRRRRFVPHFVFGVLLLAAGAVLGLLWLERQPPIGGGVVKSVDAGQVLEPPAALVLTDETKLAITHHSPASVDVLPTPTEPAPDLLRPAQAYSHPVRPEGKLPETQLVDPVALDTEEITSASNTDERTGGLAKRVLEVHLPDAESASPEIFRPDPDTSVVVNGGDGSITPSAAESVQVQDAAPSEFDEGAVRTEALSVLARLTEAYAAGDLDALMTLFTSDARNNRGGYDAIRADYRAFFDTSSRRGLMIDAKTWIVGGDAVVILGRFESSVRRSGGLLRDRSVGEIRFEMQRENGVLKIRRMLHAES